MLQSWTRSPGTVWAKIGELPQQTRRSPYLKLSSWLLPSARGSGNPVKTGILERVNARGRCKNRASAPSRKDILPGVWQLESSVNDPDDAAPESEEIAKSQKPN